MKVFQNNITFRERRRGFHIITQEVIAALPQIREIKVGILQVFIQHTSASITINENADYTVREDFETHFNEMIPENQPYYKHDYEGADDMPAHLKSSILGCSVSIPITDGKLALGIWQGIYLCEHRNNGGKRNLIVTAWGL